MRDKLRLRVLVPIAVLAVLGVGYSAFAFTGTPAEEPLPAPAAQPQTATGAATKKPRAHPKNAAQPTAPAVTRADWVRQANAVCGTGTAAVAELGEPRSVEDAAQLLPQVLASAERTLNALRAVPPSTRDATAIARMNGQFATFLALEKQAADALTAQNIEQYVELNARAFHANDAGSAIARRLGANECAKGDSKDSRLQHALDRHDVVVAVLYAPDSYLDAMMVREARLGAEDADVGFVTVKASDAASSALLARSYGIRTPPAVLVFVAGQGAVETFTNVVDRETVAQAADDAGL